MTNTALLNFNIYNTLILVGTLQGFIFAGVVFLSKKYKSRSNFYLALLILAVSLNNLQYFFRDSNMISFLELMGIYYIPYATLNTTFLYGYFVSLLNPEINVWRRIRWLFIPFAFFLIVSTGFKILIFQNPDSEAYINAYGLFANFHEIFAALYSFSILIVGYLLIKSYERTHDEFDLKNIKQHLTWLKITVILLFILVFVYLYLMVRVLLYPNMWISFYALWIGNSFMIYWLGHIGIYKYGIYKERKQIRKFSKQPIPKPIVRGHDNENIQALDALLVDGKRFLDSRLNLDQIASELQMSSGHLSRVINSELQMGFSEYVNSLRVEEAKMYLSNLEFENYTLTAIGLEAGFNSKSTFYASFKKLTGLTPAQYKGQQIPEKIQVS